MIAAAKVSFDLCNDMSGDKRTLKSFGLQMWATPFPCSALPHPPSSKRQWISDDLQLCVVRISKMNLWWDLNPMAINAPFAVNYKAKYFLYYFCRCGLHASWFAEQLREFTIVIFFVLFFQALHFLSRSTERQGQLRLQQQRPVPLSQIHRRLVQQVI